MSDPTATEAQRVLMTDAAPQSDQQRARDLASEAVTHDSICRALENSACDCGAVQALEHVTGEILSALAAVRAESAAQIAELERELRDARDSTDRENAAVERALARAQDAGHEDGYREGYRDGRNE